MHTSEHYHHEPESVRQDIGYDIPYDPSDITVEQARQLYSLGLGGKDVARIARRAADREFFDSKVLGQPEGAHDGNTSPEDALTATERWAERNIEILQTLEVQRQQALEHGDPEAAARLQARIERQHKVAIDISQRIMRLSDRLTDNEESD